MLPAEMEAFVAELGEPSYRARQIFDWVHNKGVAEIDEMTNLSKSFRTALGEVAFVTRLRLVAQRESQTGQAVKFLFEVPTGERVESVLIVDGARRTVCISSQVGCPLDCKFCATGRMGLVRNLTPGDILDGELRALHVGARGEARKPSAERDPVARIIVRRDLLEPRTRQKPPSAARDAGTLKNHSAKDAACERSEPPSGERAVLCRAGDPSIRGELFQRHPPRHTPRVGADAVLSV